MTTLHTRGSRAFHRYLLKSELGEREAAERFRVSHATINYWRNGKRRPDVIMRDAIENITNGAVKALWWRTKEENARASGEAPRRARP